MEYCFTYLRVHIVTWFKIILLLSKRTLLINVENNRKKISHKVNFLLKVFFGLNFNTKTTAVFFKKEIFIPSCISRYMLSAKINDHGISIWIFLTIILFLKLNEQKIKKMHKRYSFSILYPLSFRNCLQKVMGQDSYVPTSQLGVSPRHIVLSWRFLLEKNW